jgi:hypothetical protein
MERGAAWQSSKESFLRFFAFIRRIQSFSQTK